MLCEGLLRASAFRLAATYESRRQAGESSGMIYIAECNLGRGVFAKRAIRKGEILLAFGGARIDFAEMKLHWQPPLQLATRPTAPYHSRDV
jgi:hypothetical protein